MARKPKPSISSKAKNSKNNSAEADKNNWFSKLTISAKAKPFEAIIAFGTVVALLALIVLCLQYFDSQKTNVVQRETLQTQWPQILASIFTARGNDNVSITVTLSNPSSSTTYYLNNYTCISNTENIRFISKEPSRQTESISENETVRGVSSVKTLNPSSELNLSCKFYVFNNPSNNPGNSVTFCASINKLSKQSCTDFPVIIASDLKSESAVP